VSRDDDSVSGAVGDRAGIRVPMRPVVLVRAGCLDGRFAVHRRLFTLILKFMPEHKGARSARNGRSNGSPPPPALTVS
jgi:hypothetical protein